MCLFWNLLSVSLINMIKQCFGLEKEGFFQFFFVYSSCDCFKLQIRNALIRCFSAKRVTCSNRIDNLYCSIFLNNKNIKMQLVYSSDPNKSHILSKWSARFPWSSDARRLINSTRSKGQQQGRKKSLLQNRWSMHEPTGVLNNSRGQMSIISFLLSLFHFN